MSTENNNTINQLKQEVEQVTTTVNGLSSKIDKETQNHIQENTRMTRKIDQVEDTSTKCN